MLADNTSVWGRKTARERYGSLDKVNLKAADHSAPQFPEDKRGPDWLNKHPNDWVVGGPNESAEGKPGFDKGA